MMMAIAAMAAVAGVVMTTSPLPARNTVGSGWGTNIHWTSETRPGETAMLAKAFKVARMDFTWGRIEATCGKYNFSAYDTLLTTMEAHGVQPYWILDYGNPCYPEILTKADLYEGAPLQRRGLPRAGSPAWNKPCSSPSCIAAFGKFAAAAVAHFKGHNVIFECMNEPNGMGLDSSKVITALCLAAGAEIKAAGELFVGPATSGFAWSYLNESMADGILAAFGAVSVHPYRGEAPETVLDDYSRLRGMIQSHGATAAEKTLPIVSGEWGYTTATKPCVYTDKCDAATQAAYLARMWLVNALDKIPVSINYDWSDGSGSASDCESHFGSVSINPGSGGQPFAPKPKYTAAVTLQMTLGTFERVAARIVPTTVAPAVAIKSDVFVLPFENATGGGQQGFAVWSNYSTEVPCDNAPVEQRSDCGHLFIDKGDCLAPSNPKGPTCCWEPNVVTVGGPQCYRVLKEEAVTVGFVAPSPAKPSDAWLVTGVLGQALGSAHTDAHGIITVATGVGTPVYLTPTPGR